MLPTVQGTDITTDIGSRPPTQLEMLMAKKVPAALKPTTFKKGSSKTKRLAAKGGRKSRKKGS